MSIKILITGGTIDKQYTTMNNGTFVFEKSHVPRMLKQARCASDIAVETVMLKDSLYMTEEDRGKILERCEASEEDRIVITHGTDTMVETAKVLGKKLKGKTVVLLGALIPYTLIDLSDALFNLGSAIASVRLLPSGVYITMNGKIFTWDNVRKNKQLEEFEELRPNPQTS